ncbi:xaa-Arg dipeptidase-like [Amblyomma americanum]
MECAAQADDGHLTVTYTGRASHAADSPCEGVNAADAAVSAYVSLAILRQRIKPTSRVLALIEECGYYPNIITEARRLVCLVLTADQWEPDALKARAERCLFAAAPPSTAVAAARSSGKTTHSPGPTGSTASFAIASAGANHSKTFATAVVSREAQSPTRRAAKTQAVTALELHTDVKLLTRVKQVFHDWKSSQQEDRKESKQPCGS